MIQPSFPLSISQRKVRGFAPAVQFPLSTSLYKAVEMWKGTAYWNGSGMRG